MASRPAATGSARTIRKRERIVDFVPAAVNAPFSLRCGSLLADYLLIVMLPVAFLLISRISGNDGASLINSGLNDLGWLSAILIAFVSGMLLPIATGRTFGKFVTGLRIVNLDGTEPVLAKIVIRQSAALLLFILTAGLSFFVSVVTPNGRALHDYIAGTMVIYAEKRSR